MENWVHQEMERWHDYGGSFLVFLVLFGVATIGGYFFRKTAVYQRHERNIRRGVVLVFLLSFCLFLYFRHISGVIAVQMFVLFALLMYVIVKSSSK